MFIVYTYYVVIFFFFFFKQKTAYEMLRSLVGSEMCIRDRTHPRYGPQSAGCVWSDCLCTRASTAGDRGRWAQGWGLQFGYPDCHPWSSSGPREQHSRVYPSARGVPGGG
eukprot:TRINITY_DN9219_c0_g2_i2.p3 TRINITY_DN9219_c0_g2~~TRINITY_DN9219_c0_g2_i2.p3  ORF type:complete len:110 (+),score=22.64 TRINITY_DN9219_c0_g2_i2:20-349(+)